MPTTNKIAVITGGSRGLGQNMAVTLAKQGVHIYITYNNNDVAAKQVIAEAEALGVTAKAIQLDVASTASITEFTTQLASQLNGTGIDYLVNNAGVGTYAPITQTPESELDKMYAIHVKAPFLLAQHLYPHFNEGGAIVNIGTGLTRFSYDGYAAYAIMKGAVNTLTNYMAKEFGAKKIRVNTVAPGAIETDFGGGAVRDNKDLNAMIAQQTALGRVGLPDDIGGVVAFLCSDAAKWVNAQRIEVSGGIYI
jgi:NAD(P)-dependent dehydrogenase (short-subunit alcohol dehydrogenase family)